MSPDVVTDTEWTRPIPRPDAVSAPYWEAAARGELVIQECPTAGTGSSIRGRSAPTAAATSTG